MAMSSLLLAGNLPDHAEFIRNVAEENIFCGILIAVFILLAPLTVMGMLAGVLVEVVGVVSAVEKESMVVGFVREQMQEILRAVDEDGNESICLAEFQALVVRPDAARMMSSVGVDVLGLAEYCDFLFKDNSKISFAAFLDLILQLRGSNNATVKDVIDMRKFLRQELTQTMEHMELTFTSQFAPIVNELKMVRQSPLMQAGRSQKWMQKTKPILNGVTNYETPEAPDKSTKVLRQSRQARRPSSTPPARPQTPAVPAVEPQQQQQQPVSGMPPPATSAAVVHDDVMDDEAVALLVKNRAQSKDGDTTSNIILDDAAPLLQSTMSQSPSAGQGRSKELKAKMEGPADTGGWEMTS
jgi:hypothetical protein